MHPPFFSLIIACHFTEVLNCMSNRLRLHAILSISLTKPHLVQLINITPQSISSCDQYMHNYYNSHCIPIHVCTPLLKSLATGLVTITIYGRRLKFHDFNKFSNLCIPGFILGVCDCSKFSIGNSTEPAWEIFSVNGSELLSLETAEFMKGRVL